jgi:hypothetical protein
METHEGPAAPASGPNRDSDNDDDIPTFEELAADPEIASLLDFEPIPRANTREDGWTAPLQRMFMAYLAYYGSPGKACDALGKRRSGIDKLSKKPEAKSFREAWKGAVELAEERRAAKIAADHAGMGSAQLPFIDHRRKHLPPPQTPLPGRPPTESGQWVRNEDGEWEDAESYRERGEEAADSIRHKLLRIRRIYLQDISDSPGKRAAFEILTDLPIDWDKAAAGEPQDDEPYRNSNQRQPDMILTAESGWSFGEIGYGPDRKAELRAAIDAHRAEEGLPAVDWSKDPDEDGEEEEDDDAAVQPEAGLAGPEPL